MNTGRNRIVIRKTKPANTKEQKVGFVLVISIGVLSFLMGGLYIGSHLDRAFDYEYDGPPLLTLKQQQEQALLELQTSDTDGDGLTDYEELYFQRTSPYLADTDGDGKDDSEEVLAGTDPNCDGDLCDTAIGSQTETVQPVIDLSDIQPGAEVAAENSQILSELVTGITPAEIRVYLIDGGVDAEQVATLSDEEIMAIYEETLIDLDNSGELDALIEEVQ